MSDMYQHKYKYGELRICDICGRTSKETSVTWCNKYEMTLCSKHRHHMERHGEILNRTTWDSNDYVLYDDYAEIILRNKNGSEVGRTIIDLDDVDRCKQQTWRMIISKKGGLKYASCMLKGKKKSKSLHRFIMNYDGELQIDHINRNSLDNRKSNLRIVTGFENMANNKYDGVHKHGQKYLASVRRKNIHYYFGSYKTKEEAIEIVNKARALYDENYDTFIEYMKTVGGKAVPHYKTA